MKTLHTSVPLPLRRAIRKRARRVDAPYDSILQLESRILFANQHVRGRNKDPWVVRDYQIASAESRATRKVNCCARDVGKSAEVALTACWASICMPNATGLITAPLDNMLQPIMHELRRQCESSPGIAANLDASAMSPSWRFKFKNGFLLYGRIGGLTGLNYKGMHVDWAWVDEAQDMTQSAWRELYPAINPGGKLWLYGVPNGIRGDFYQATKDPDYEQHHWPMTLNPNVTHRELKRLEKAFGGRDAPAYIHNVEGRFCDASALAFPIDLLTPTDTDYVLATYDAVSGTMDRDIYGPDYRPCYMGVDLGFAEDPTEVVLFHEDEFEQLHTVVRVHIGHCTYDKLACILAEMIAQWQPHAVGIDAGGPGLPVIHLLARHAARTEVFPVFFNAFVTWTPPELAGGVRGYLKQMLTDAMAAEIAAGTLRFAPQDAERMEQYGAHVVMQTGTGRMTYSKGNDHIIDADRCAYFAARNHLFLSCAEPSMIETRIAEFGEYEYDRGINVIRRDSL